MVDLPKAIAEYIEASNASDVVAGEKITRLEIVP